MSSSTDLGFLATTRGNGKIYTLIKGRVDAPVWKAESHIAGGGAVPAKVYTLPDGRKVLVTPVLSVSQTASVTACDEAGNMVATATRRIEPHIATVRSKVNTALRGRHIEELRNCDESPLPSELGVCPVRRIHRDKESDLLHVIVSFCPYDPALGKPPVTLSVLGLSGSSVALGNPVCLGDVIEPAPAYPNMSRRTCCYSIPIERDCDWLCVGASCPASGLVDNFTCVRPHEMWDLLVSWDSVYLGYEGFDPNYHDWYLQYKSNSSELALQRQTSRELPLQPLFSIVVPLYHTPLGFFRDMAQTALEQTYPNLELVLVNSTPQDVELTEAVEQLARDDARVRVVTLDHNLGITENTNAGIDACTGDYICFFDHDDLLEPDLLYWYARGINDYPETDLLYCDEDKLLDGAYADPFYKPDWNLLFLETNNYVCHMLTVRKELIDALPAQPDKALDGAQDHNMTLQIGADARNVYHVRRILYHWRVHQNSTALNSEAKPESLIAGRIAIERYNERAGIAAHVIDAPERLHCYLTIYDDVSTPPITAVIAPATCAADIERSEASLWALGLDGLEVRSCGTVPDGKQDSTALARELATVTTPYVLLLNAGVTFPDAEAFTQLVALAQRKDVAIASPKVILPDQTCLYNGVALHDGDFHPKHPFHHLNGNVDRSMSSLPHCVTVGSNDCLLFKREVLDAIGGLPADTPLDLWGMCLCLLAREQGLTVAQFPLAYVEMTLDAEGLDAGPERRDARHERRRRYLMEHFPSLMCAPDHYYKPML